jgi:ABC-2 type transport system permease protein
MLKRLLAIIKKEARHIFRDPRTLSIVIAMPIMMVLIYGYALEMDLTDIRIAVIDQDRTPDSRWLTERFEASEYFDVVLRPERVSDVHGLFIDRKIHAALVIPPGFARAYTNLPSAAVQLLVDGSDPTYGNAVINYTTAVTANAVTVSVEDVFPLEIRNRFHYNQSLEGSHFVIPGLVAVILMMICALLTSITITREKESGTLDVVLVSPIRPGEVIIGKTIPYILLSLVDAVFILVFAKIVFDIPLRGDLTLLLGLTILYIYCALGIGLLISSIAATQQVAMMAALVATILPSMVLSGFIFPIFSMPLPIRIITHIVPARYYMEIIRGILLKSSPLSMLLHQAAALGFLGTFYLIVATIRFQKGRTT